MFPNSLVEMSSVFAQSVRGKWCVPELWHLTVTTSVAGQLPRWESLQNSGARKPLKLPGCVHWDQWALKGMLAGYTSSLSIVKTGFLEPVRFNPQLQCELGSGC